MLYPDLTYINPNILKSTVFDRTKLDASISNQILSRNGTPKILDGDWDIEGQTEIEFEKMDVYIAIKDHFIHGVDWTKTKLYERVSRCMRDGTYKTSVWGCNTPKQYLDNYLKKKLTNVYNDIRKNGYKTQKQVVIQDQKEREQGKKKYNNGIESRGSSDEIRVIINRKGEIVFLDGRHRLSISKILGLNSIPVKIMLRHKKWVDFQETILNYAKKRPNGKIYQRITEHPDLNFIPAMHTDNRFAILKKSIKDYNCKGKKLIDIGTHWGHMAHYFEKLGFKCTATENMLSNIHYLKGIRDACSKKFDIWYGDVLDYPNIEKMDVIVALNIFHHFCKTRSKHIRFVKFLKRIKADIMLFQAHLHDPPGQMKNAYRNYSETEFVKFISKHTGLNNWKKIGVSPDKRPIYKLWKSY